MTSPRHAAVVGGNRIPFARANGPYATESNQAMLTAAIDGLAARFSLGGERVDEVVAGAVLKHARDFNLTREAVLGSALDSTSPCYDVQQACDTGLEATVLVANKIALGQIDVGIAGGADTASDAPVGLNEDLRKVLMEARRAKSAGQRVKLLGKLRPGQIVPAIRLQDRASQHAPAYDRHTDGPPQMRVDGAGLIDGLVHPDARTAAAAAVSDNGDDALIHPEDVPSPRESSSAPPPSQASPGPSG